MFSGRKLSDETAIKILDFYNDDRCSSMMPGKKDCVSTKDSNGVKIYTQKSDTRYPLDCYSDCFDFTICHSPTPACYLRKCKKCPAIDTLCDIIKNRLEENNVESITYKQWIPKPRTSLMTIMHTADEFAGEFCEKITALMPHSFVAKEQGNCMKEVKESLKENVFLRICDFAENYAFVVPDAAPGYHWNNNSATVYTVVIYYNCKQKGGIAHQSLAIISDCMAHDAVAVHAYTKIVVNLIKSINSNASKIIYFSDGAPQQYKNYKNFVNLAYHQQDFGIFAEWNFLLRPMVKVHVMG